MIGGRTVTFEEEGILERRLRLYRSPLLLSLIAGLASLFLFSLPVADAQAETLTMDRVVAAQSQAWPTDGVQLAPVTREGYTVQVYTVVQWPVASSSPVSSGFGWRTSPCRGCSSDHMGVDLTPGGGTPIEVVADGIVIAAGPIGGLGYRVVVAHTIDGVYTETTYGHMRAGSITVYQGQSVPRGTVLGVVGNTGASTGNHLHFEVHVGGGAIDPYAWIQAHANDWMWN